MSQYELTFLLNEASELKTLKELITSLGGTIQKEHIWGEKNLAYPIKRILKAQYYQWIIQLPKEKAMELRKLLSFNEKLIRYLLLAVEN